MIAHKEELFEAWSAFQHRVGGLKQPRTEAEYLEVIYLLDELTDRYNFEEEPWGSLFDLLAHYAREWEKVNEPLSQDPGVGGAEVLAVLLEEHGLTQTDLEREGIADQTVISRVLSGERAISKALAKRLAERFKVSVELFL